MTNEPGTTQRCTCKLGVSTKRELQLYMLLTESPSLENPELSPIQGCASNTIAALGHVLATPATRWRRQQHRQSKPTPRDCTTNGPMHGTVAKILLPIRVA